MYFIFQKVEYYGKDIASMTYYTSVIRSCSQGHCIPHADNCSDKLLANPGCMIRHCCDDRNLCNDAQVISYGGMLYVVILMSNVIAGS